jgi:hypothetical protein
MKKSEQMYNSRSQIRVSGGDRMNRRGRHLRDLEGGSVPTLDVGRRKNAKNRDHSIELPDTDRVRTHTRWQPGTLNPVDRKKRRFKFTRSSFDEPIHLDKSSSRLRSRFNDLFVLGDVPERRKRRDDEIDIHRNRMVFLAFTAGLAVYVLYKLLVSA